MEKIYFRDNQKLTLLKSLIVMSNLASNLKDPLQLLDMTKTEKMRKIFVERYTMSTKDSEPELAVEIAEKCLEIGIDIDIEQLKLNCVIGGIIELKTIQSLTQAEQEIINKSKIAISNTFIYDFIYVYLEENLKKVIISELFKRLFCINYNLDLNIKVSSEKLEQIFANQPIKNKESFFCQQLQNWFIYNKIIEFVKYEIREREEESEKKDIFMNINILKTILERKF